MKIEKKFKTKVQLFNEFYNFLEKLRNMYYIIQVRMEAKGCQNI